MWPLTLTSWGISEQIIAFHFTLPQSEKNTFWGFFELLKQMTVLTLTIPEKISCLWEQLKNTRHKHEMLLNGSIVFPMQAITVMFLTQLKVILPSLIWCAAILTKAWWFHLFPNVMWATDGSHYKIESCNEGDFVRRKMSNLLIPLKGRSAAKDVQTEKWEHGMVPSFYLDGLTVKRGLWSEQG